MMKAILRQRPPRQPLADRGMGLLEPLLLSLMLLMAVSAMANVFNSISRSMVTTQKQVIRQASIDDNLRQIKALARRFTCCAGTCITTAPVNVGVGQPCATTNPMDDRFYFPQLDLASTTTPFPNTSTSSEPLAVGQLCATANNTFFMDPLKTAVDSLPAPTNATRLTSIQDSKILRVTYMNVNGSTIREETIIPKMADFCP
jgi:ABC-type anion transport system duplicated permease subunit